MPMLVSYDSGSEDEEPSIGQKLNDSSARKAAYETIKPNGTTIDCSSSSELSSNHVDPFQEPMPILGPQMPTGLESSFASYEDDEAPSLPDLPEQDLLRYLTQPAYPMAALPPEPLEAADPVVTARFKRFLQLKSNGVHFNQDLASKTSFKNPNLFASLIERAGLPADVQYASMLPPSLLNLATLPPWAYKEDLLKSQQAYAAEAESLKRSQSASGKRMIEFISSNPESTPGSTIKRKRP